MMLARCLEPGDQLLPNDVGAASSIFDEQNAIGQALAGASGMHGGHRISAY